MVGRQPGSGPQKISIGTGCGYLGVVVHEIGKEVSVILVHFVFLNSRQGLSSFDGIKSRKQQVCTILQMWEVRLLRGRRSKNSRPEQAFVPSKEEVIISFKLPILNNKNMKGLSKTRLYVWRKSSTFDRWFHCVSTYHNHVVCSSF